MQKTKTVIHNKKLFGIKQRKKHSEAAKLLKFKQIKIDLIPKGEGKNLNALCRSVEHDEFGEHLWLRSKFDDEL